MTLNWKHKYATRIFCLQAEPRMTHKKSSSTKIKSFLQVKFEEHEMIPKSGKSPADSRKSVGIHEFAALARSSLNGNFYFPSCD